MPRFSILPTEESFFDWFEKGASNLVQTARLLDKLLRDYSDVSTKVARITELEHHGDFIVHEVYDALHRTFVPPLERETIRELAARVDDVVDNIEAAADLMLLYEVERPSLQAVRLGEIVLACSEQLNLAMPILRNRRTITEIRTFTIEVNRLENEADGVTRAGIAELLKHRDDTFNLIRWKDIYGALEEATDRCEDVADALTGIVLEMG
jgi:predicted phosphate transport protein (TIGR00153 family)